MFSFNYSSRVLTYVSRLVLAAVAFLLIYSPNVHAKLVMASATPTSVTLSWTAPGDDGNTGTAAVYDIRYSTGPITDLNWSQATPASGLPAPQPAGSAESFTVTNLQPGTTYYFAIKTADEVPNWSALSNVVSVATEQELEAPSNVTDFAVLGSYRYSVLLGWTAPGDDGDSGTAAVYDIRYHTATITEINWDSAVQIVNEPAPNVAGTAETCTVVDLDESTIYYFAIKTADESANWSGLSNVVSTSTTGDETPPASIDDLEVASGENDGEIDLSWTAPGDDELFGSALAYEIRYSLGIISAENWDSASLCPSPPEPLPCGSEQTHTLCELEPGEMYYVAMRAVDDADNVSAVSNIDSAVAHYSFITGTEDDLPQEYTLAQNYPNPFNPVTEILFSLASDCHVTLDIFNTAGQRVTTLVDERLPAGNHATRWDGKSSSGQSVATGVYFYRIQAEDFFDSKKMVLLK